MRVKPEDRPAAIKTDSKRSSRAETEHRIDVIFSLLISGAIPREIVSYATKTWSIGKFSVYHYIDEARALIKKSHVTDRGFELARELLRRDMLYKRALQEEGVRAALAVADSRCELLGLFEPLVIEHRTENPYASLTQEEIDFALEALDELTTRRQKEITAPQEPKRKRAR